MKFVSPDGHYEVIFHEDGTLVTDVKTAGTYNYSFDPNGGYSDNVSHFILDIVEYYVYGNGPVFVPDVQP
jgi:hypothetical protein